MAKPASLALDATHQTVDDILWKASHGELSHYPQITIMPSGHVGPLVELAIARHRHKETYDPLNVKPTLYKKILNAINFEAISGGSFNDNAGAFPLSIIARRTPRLGESSLLQWKKHVENQLVKNRFSRTFATGLIGAIGELQDNIFEHSGSPATGLLAYGIDDKFFEFVVSDAGEGVLATLRQNPEFKGLRDSSEALPVAVTENVSRFDRSFGRGFGFATLFRALMRHSTALRFRSGDAAMYSECYQVGSLEKFNIVQKAWLDGLTISVRFPLP